MPVHIRPADPSCPLLHRDTVECMGKHRKPNLLKRRLAVAVPAVAITAVLLTGSSQHSAVTTADVMQPNLEPIHNTAPFQMPSQWQIHQMEMKKAIKKVVPVPRPIIRKAQTVVAAPTVTATSSAPVTPPPVHLSGDVQQKVLKAAESQLGVPYVYGGEDPGVDFDCSGLVQWAYAQAGVAVPRVADDQFNFFKTIPKSEAVPGDLVFFHDNSDSGSYVYHVGIYDGGDMMIVAPTEGQDVQIQNFTWGGDTVTFGALTN